MLPMARLDAQRLGARKGARRRWTSSAEVRSISTLAAENPCTFQNRMHCNETPPRGAVSARRASSTLPGVSAAATMNPSSSTPMCSFLQARRRFDALCLWMFHSPEPRIYSPVESTIRSIGPSWARVSGCTSTI